MRHDSFFSKTDPPYIIAELGSFAPHKELKQTIDKVSDAGVDAVKFQYFVASDLVPGDDARFDMYVDCMWSTFEFGIKPLIDYARSKLLDVGCSFFSTNGIHAYGSEVDFIKIASPESTWTALIEAARASKPTLVSVPWHIKTPYEMFKDVDYLDCWAGYPAVFKKPLTPVQTSGISDHTLGFQALSLTPKIIEKHFGSSEGPNGPVNMHPDNAKMFVDIAHNRYKGPKPTLTRSEKDGFRYRPPTTTNEKPEPSKDLLIQMRDLLTKYEWKLKDETE